MEAVGCVIIRSKSHERDNKQREFCNNLSNKVQTDCRCIFCCCCFFNPFCCMNVFAARFKILRDPRYSF